MSPYSGWRAAALGEEKRLETSAGTLAYREAGHGPPLVLVHGFLVNANLWRKVVPLLAPHFRCLAIDWPLGSHCLPARSSADLSPPGIAALIAEFLARMELEEVTLLGNDSGGAYAQMVAARGEERVSRLVLSSCETPGSRWPPTGFGHLKAAAQVPGGLTALVQPLRLPPAWRSRTAYGRLAKRPIDHDAMRSFVDPFLSSAAIRRDARKVVRDVGGAHHRLAAERLIGEWDRPVEFVWAAEDRVFPIDDARIYAAALPDARVAAIADSYTYVAEDNPAGMADALTATLAPVAG
jgi:pimeloyl-ACP methyl ester carboxylesterase